MRPELFKLEFNVALSLALYLFFLALTFVVALRARPRGTAIGAAAGPAFWKSLVASVTCGLFGSRDPKAPPESGPDLFIPGTLATLCGLVPLAIVLLRGKFELPVQSYPVAMAVGFVVVIWLCAIRLRARGFQQAHILDVAIICILAGPIGSRAFFVVEYWNDYFADRPAAVESGTFSKPGKGEEIVIQSDRVHASLAFSGNEHGWSEVAAVLGTLEPALHTRLVTLDRRGSGSEVLHIVRGLALETRTRGPAAWLQVSGPAAQRLGLATAPGGSHGLAVPWVETLKIWNGGIVFYGGLILATICSILYLAFRRYPILAFADGIGPVLGIGLAFGRFGCLLNGCCWGTEVSGPSSVALRFPLGSFPWNQHMKTILSPAYDALIDRPFDAAGHLVAPLAAAVPTELAAGSRCVHPVQLYDAFADLGLAALVYAFGRFVAKREGQTFFLFYIGYAITRFVVEHFRGDQDQFWPLFGYSLTMSQVVSLVTLPVALGLFVWASRRTPRAGDVVPVSKTDVVAAPGA